MRKSISFFFAIFFMVFAVSCNEDEVSFEAEVDVFTISHYNQEGVPEFANAYYAYANKSMKNVEVSTPMGDPIELSPNGGLNSNYFKEPNTNEEFTTSQPMPGTYEFEITTNNNKTLLFSDHLENSFIMPVNITQGSIEDNILKVKWQKNENALAYLFRILNEEQNERKVLLSSGFIESDSIVADLRSLNFQSEMPVAGNNYTLEVRAYRFESNKEVNLEYNIQAVSSAQKSITWE